MINYKVTKNPRYKNKAFYKNEAMRKSSSRAFQLRAIHQTSTTEAILMQSLTPTSPFFTIKKESKTPDFDQITFDWKDGPPKLLLTPREILEKTVSTPFDDHHAKINSLDQKIFEESLSDLQECNKKVSRAIDELSQSNSGLEDVFASMRRHKCDATEIYTVYAAAQSLEIPQKDFTSDLSLSEKNKEDNRNFWKLIGGMSQATTRAVAQTAPIAGSMLGGTLGSVYSLGVVYATSLLNGVFQAYLKKRLVTTHLKNSSESLKDEPHLINNVSSFSKNIINEKNELLENDLTSIAQSKFIPLCQQILRKN